MSNALVREMAQAIAALGERVRHLETLENARMPVWYTVGATSSLTLTTTYQDIPGLTATFTVPAGGENVLVIGHFQLEAGSTPQNFQIRLNYDGTGHGTVVVFNAKTEAGMWNTVSGAWVVPLTAGSRTIKFQARDQAAGGVGDTVLYFNSNMVYARGVRT